MRASEATRCAWFPWIRAASDQSGGAAPYDRDRPRRPGITPFLIVGTAGTVDTGAIDDLDGLAVIASEQRLWLHVDGAYGALGILAPEIAPRLAGIQAADSLAFDFHKWGQVPYDAGFVLVRDGELHRKAFASPAAYLEREAAWAGRRVALAVRIRTGSFARIPGAQNLVHAEGLWPRSSRPDDRAHLRAGPLSGTEGHTSRMSWSCSRPFP